jgi:hypothetical protein
MCITSAVAPRREQELMPEAKAALQVVFFSSSPCGHPQRDRRASARPGWSALACS